MSSLHTTVSDGYIHKAPFNESMLQVDDIHSISFTQWGNPEGLPAIFLHGGPGGSTSILNTRFFNPERYHVVLFDQRGTGKSKPLNEIRSNTTQHLAKDIESLRVHLGISQWHIVFGGSWGSALTLFYSQTHPDKVKHIIIRGVTTLRPTDFRWSRMSDSGAAKLFPEEWYRFLNHLPDDLQDDPVAGYYKLLTSSDQDPMETVLAARAFSRWDLTLTSRYGQTPSYSRLEDDAWCFTHALLETHYFSHNCWLDEDQLIRDISKITHIKATIVQGRQDFICPPWAAWYIHQLWPNSTLYIVDKAGHSDAEPGMQQRLIEACDLYSNTAA